MGTFRHIAAAAVVCTFPSFNIDVQYLIFIIYLFFLILSTVFPQTIASNYCFIVVFSVFIVYCLFTCYFFRGRRQGAGGGSCRVQSWSADQIRLVTPTSAGKSRCLYNLLKWSIFLLHQRPFARVFVCASPFGLSVRVILL